MSLEITFLGHAAFLIAHGGRRVLVDPFLTGNPKASTTAGAVECDAIVVTHGHEDHVGDVAAIAQRTGATVHAAFEITNWLGEQGVEHVSPLNPGGKAATDFGFVALTQAFHSSSYQGRYMGMPCGAIVSFASAEGGGPAVYHAGDTALFSDMRLIGEIYRPTVAILPIGDRFTMGPALASRAADLVGAPHVIPCHYDTWPPIEQDPGMLRPASATVHALAPGATARL